MARWTEKRVVELAPDDSSVNAARRLLNPALWSETGSTEILVWGKCQGSGKTPYQVSVDLAGPAFRCSCPSRKFPCKHALALLLLWVRGSGGGRRRRPGGRLRPGVGRRKRAAKIRGPSGPRRERRPDPAAQAKRVEERLALMTAGSTTSRGGCATWSGPAPPPRASSRTPGGTDRRPARRRAAARPG